MIASGPGPGRSPADLISKRIAELGGWRGVTLARMRRLIREADPEVVEECKWMGSPVWSQDGILCTGEACTSAVKLTSPRGREGGEKREVAGRADLPSGPCARAQAGA